MKYLKTVFDDKNRPSYEYREVIVIEDKLDTNPERGNKLVNYAFIQSKMNNVLGQVLTVVDASVSDSRQNKAMKDIIKGIFINEYCVLSELLFDKASMEELTTFYESNPDDMERLKEMEEITEDEALGLTK